MPAWIRQRLASLIALVAGSLVGVGLVATGRPAAGAETPAQLEPAAVEVKRADAFVNSVGVNVHLNYLNTTYAQYDTVIRPRLKELGVRHLRDGSYRDASVFYARVRELGAMGFRFSLIASPGVIDTPAALRQAIQAAGPALVQVEGPNELDTTGTGWEDKLRAFQPELYAAARADLDWVHIAVAAPSLANTRDSPGKLGPLHAHLDVGNLHNYPGGAHVGSPRGGGWDISFDQAVAEARKVCGNKPLVATETGYHNNLVRGEHPGVSEEAAAKLIPRVLCYHYARGVRRTYLYEFADQHRDDAMTTMEWHFGLIRWDGSPKPAFVAVRNLLALLADPGPPFTPAPLRLALRDHAAGGTDTSDVCPLVLQKRDGRVYVVLWREVASFDLENKEDLDVPARPVTLKLGRRFARAAEFLPSRGGGDRPGRVTQDVDELRLNVPDELLVVELTPAAPG